MTGSQDKKTSYADAGVSIDRGNALVERIKSAAAATRNAGVMEGLGGFGALFDLSRFGYKDPVLVSGTDGVGTKLKLAIEMRQHGTIGIDLVAMCVNDLIVQGARPLFFLDYFACGKLDVDVAATVISGIADGCRASGCALIGGETAEMPGVYHEGDYDLAGFAVGAVERDQIINGHSVNPGDVLIALGSSGPHSNGYSLIRKILRDSNTALDTSLHGKPIGTLLLAPTRLYVQSILKLMESVQVKAIAHITGGGLLENIPRVLPEQVCAVLDTGTWRLSPIFEWLRKQGNVEIQEMYRTFNCGVGMVVCVDKKDKDTALRTLTASGETAWIIGRIDAHSGDSHRVQFTGSH